MFAVVENDVFQGGTRVGLSLYSSYENSFDNFEDACEYLAYKECASLVVVEVNIRARTNVVTSIEIEEVNISH